MRPFLIPVGSLQAIPTSPRYRLRLLQRGFTVQLVSFDEPECRPNRTLARRKAKVEDEFVPVGAGASEGQGRRGLRPEALLLKSIAKRRDPLWCPCNQPAADKRTLKLR